MIDIQTLQAHDVGHIQTNALLSEHSTWKIGGPADVLIQPSNTDQLSGILQYVDENRLTYIVIGDGSNLLFDDAGFRGVVIKISRAMSECKIEGQTVYAQAGIAVSRLARKVGVGGLTGIEHTMGIPGTLGGLVAMNGGGQPIGIGEVIKTVVCIDDSGRQIQMQYSDCEFSYRNSIFLQKPWVITDVALQLQKGQANQIHSDMLQILRERRRKFPRRLPSCGSVFKSDPILYENTVLPVK